MKKIVSILLATLLIFGCGALSAFAEENQDALLSKTVEVLDNGDTVVTEIYESSIQPRAGKSGYKTSTYVNSFGTKIWAVTVNGTFNYTYGVSCKATTASAVVETFNSTAKFVSKNAYTSANKATATATVNYSGSQTTRVISISCDIYGNLY